MNRMIVVSTKGPVHSIMFDDIKGSVVYIDEKITIRNTLLRVINKLHESRKVNKVLQLPYKELWEKHYNLSRVIGEDGAKILFTDVSVTDYRIKYLKELVTQKKCKLFLLMINPVAKPDLYAGSIKDYIAEIPFERIYSFDQADSAHYGFTHTLCIYSKYPLQKKKKTSDILFVGTDKGRAKIINDVFKNAVKAGLTCEFYVKGIEADSERIDGIQYDFDFSYIEVLEKVNTTKCILEIVQEGQNGVTFRTFEAICYNKYLLTNNQHIFDVIEKDKYINILYFENVDEIDWEWVKAEMCKGGDEYADEFSPRHLLEQIESMT